MDPLARLSSQDPSTAFEAHFLARLHCELRNQNIHKRDFAEALGIPRQNADRRLAGKTAFLVGEVLRLQRAFDIRSDEVAPQLLATTTYTTVPAGAWADYTTDEYVAQFSASLAPFLQVAESGEPPRLSVSTTDLPLFALLGSPLLTALVFFFHRDEVTVDRGAFDVTTYREEYARAIHDTRELYRAYRAIDSIEVWGTRPLRGILKKARSLHRDGVFSTATCSAIMRALAECCEVLRESCARGRKSGGGTFRLYVCDRCAKTTTMSFETVTVTATYVTLNGPVLLHTSSPAARQIFRDQFASFRRRAREVNSSNAVAFTGAMRQACERAAAGVAEAPAW